MSVRPQYHADIGVITTVGFTLLTRMLYRPSSRAETRVMLSNAAFDEPYEMCPLSATRLAWLETFTMAPPRPSRIIERAVYLVTRSAPRVLMMMTLSKTSMSVSIGVAISPPKPPQLTTPVDVQAVERVADALLGGQVEGRSLAPVSTASSASAVGRPAAGDDVCAGRDELTDGLATDPAARTGDQDGAAVEVSHEDDHSLPR